MSNSSDRKTFVIDIDGTICSQDGANYETAKPNQKVIDVGNRLFDNGHKIVYFTARGSTTGIDWSKVTESQLSNWGVRYHELLFGKPYGNYYVDDKSMAIDDFLNLGQELNE
jgi:CMP-N,N'-diacetyllegionaminic acid synthase